MTAEAFDSFYSEHFVKLIKTMKVRINVVSAITKKFNKMRDLIIHTKKPEEA